MKGMALLQIMRKDYNQCLHLAHSQVL